MNLNFDVIFQITTGNVFFDALARLFSAILLSYIVGAERSTRQKVAGVRTHCLLASAGCLAALAGPILSIGGGPGQDQTRLAGQILTGIGFVGAGAIVHRGHITVGVTTAASIFFVACMGVTCGLGFPFLCAATILMLYAVSFMVRHTHPEDEAPGSRFLKVRVKAEQLEELKSILPTETRVKSMERLKDQVEVVLVVKGRNWELVDELTNQITSRFTVTLLDVQSY